MLERFEAALGWETLLNRKGTTWRQLDDAAKSGVDRAKALELMLAQPSLIKRPVLEYDGAFLIGFDPNRPWPPTPQAT
ncbi:ArsC/Spx/MgsR family protein [Methylogaea oryzae]|nr:ArsC/Spx/MgsR family protein [Methylogaea oryzae]